MNTTIFFTQSFALFDTHGNIIDWNSGFAQEFADAVIKPGVNYTTIRDACQSPSCTLDFSWLTNGAQSQNYAYGNSTITYECSNKGNIIRLATTHSSAEIKAFSEPETQIHTKEVEAANQKLSSLVKFNEAILRNSPLPMAVFTSDGLCIDANDAYSYLVNVPREDLLQVNFNTNNDWINSGMRDVCIEALESNSQQRSESQLVTIYDDKIWVEGRFLPIELNDTKHILAQLVDLTERKRHEIELRSLAFNDELTKLPNRRLLLDRLQKAVHSSKRHNTYCALLFLDLNKFKQLNDTYGHEAGDLLLIEVAHRLKRATREVDTVARLGGDEFVVLLEGLDANFEKASEQTDFVIEKIRAFLTEEYVLGTIKHNGSASIGAKLFLGDADNPETIIKEADTMMYVSKIGAK
jgi:diguanylate cyclase (GGDEF)-like protein/PAS domain S-box-containing protein